MEAISEREVVLALPLDDPQAPGLCGQIDHRLARLAPRCRLSEIIQPSVGHLQRKCRERLMQFLGHRFLGAWV
jgi:hypothetical protein